MIPFTFFSDLDFCGQRLKTVSDCQNFDPLLPKTSIDNLQLNSQSECRIQQGWKRRWTTLDRWDCRSLGRHVKAFWLHPLFCAALSMLTPLQPESGKVAVVNPDWQGHYRIPPHTSNEYGYSQTSLCACTHSHAHANLRRFSRCFCQLTSPTVHVAASCCHHAGDSTATKARQRVPANISTDETF